jgi:hypothetical protein
MQKLVNRDVIGAGVLVLFSIAAWRQAAALPSQAGMFPRLIIALLLGFSLIYLLRSLWQARSVAQDTPFFSNLPRFSLALMLTVIYVLIFPRIGFFTTTFIFIPVFAFTIGARRMKSAFLASAVFTLGAWFIFVVLLDRRLPPEWIVTALTGGAN